MRPALQLSEQRFRIEFCSGADLWRHARREDLDRLYESLRELAGWTAFGMMIETVDRTGSTRVVVRSDLSLAEGRELVARFPIAAGSLELIPEAWLVYACDPTHPERGFQSMERLRIRETTLTRERGRLGDEDSSDWPEIIERCEFGSRLELEAAFEAQQRRWDEVGALVSEDPVELFVGLCAHEPRLARQIQDASDTSELADTVVVLRDWLETQGDPRARVDADPSWFLGPFRRFVLDDLLRVEWAGCTAIGLELQLPRMLRMAPDQFRSGVDWLRTLMRLPALASLRCIEIRTEGAEMLDLRPILDAEVFAGLSTLRIECGDEHSGLASLGQSSLGRLQSLCIQASDFYADPLILPQLRELELSVCELTPRLAAALTEGRLERLELLRLRLTSINPACQDSLPLISRFLVDLELPRLREFELHLCLGPIVDAGMIEALTRAPWFDTLDSLVFKCRSIVPDAERMLGRFGPKIRFEHLGRTRALA